MTQQLRIVMANEHQYSIIIIINKITLSLQQRLEQLTIEIKISKIPRLYQKH